MVWEKFKTIFLAYDTECALTFSSLYIGFSPTNKVLESVITRVTRTIVARVRDTIISNEKLKAEIMEHCNLNIASHKSSKNSKESWERFRSIFETQF